MYKTTFAELKMRGKDMIRGDYWYCFGVCLLVILIAGLCTSVATLPATLMGTTSSIIAQNPNDYESYLSMLTPMYASYIIMIPLSLLIITPLTVGLTKFFINKSSNTHNIYDIFSPYKNNFGNFVLIQFLSGLYVFLWSLLLFIPGIIKSYQYSMISYILAENPSIGRKRAFEVTKALTDGNKWRIFLFGLSFIGWILLGSLTCGIGLFFLEPYLQSSYIQLYFDLKAEALSKGTVTEEDFIYNRMY